MTPRWLPQKPGMKAGTPQSAPRAASTPSMPAKVRRPAAADADGPRNIASMPPNLRERQRGVFLARLRRGFARYAGMAKRDDEIDARRAQSPAHGARAASAMPIVVDAAGEMALVPLHDLRRREADDADAQRLLGAGVVAQGRAPGSIQGCSRTRRRACKMLQLRRREVRAARARRRENRGHS